MVRLKINRLTLTAFFLFLLCIMTSSIVIFSVAFYDYVQTHSKAYIETKERQAERLEEALAGQIIRINDTATHFLYARWLSRLSNHIGLYEEEFDLYKRLEITSELSAQISTMEFVSDILIFIPQKNLFISSMGWFEIDHLKKYYTYLNQSETGVTSSNENILPFITHSTGYSENFTCILVDITSMNRYIRNATLEQFNSFEIILAGQILPSGLSSVSQNDEYSVIRSSRFLPHLELKLTYKPYRIFDNIENMTVLMIAIILIFLFGILVSAFLASAVTKPIHELLSKFLKTKNTSVRNYFQQLPGYIGQMIDDNTQLSAQLAIYEKNARDEAFFRLLTDTSAGVAPDDYLMELIPWWNQQLFYQVFLFARKEDSKNEEIADVSQILSRFYTHFHKINMPNCDLSYIVWFAEHTSQGEQVLGNTSSHWYIGLSDIQRDVHLISASYIQARARLDMQLESGGVRLASDQLPLSEEIQLISTIQENRKSECQKILTNIFKKQNGDTIDIVMRLLTRLAHENSIDCREYIKQYNELLHNDDSQALLNCVYGFGEFMCDAISGVKGRSTSDLAKLILDYIRNHYADSNLSLKLLSDVFQISTTLLSKIFKAEFGINFIDFVLEIRLKEAKTMLKTTDIAIVNISQAVGYQNYLSFKRAFIRTEGISPREYRERYNVAQAKQ